MSHKQNEIDEEDVYIIRKLLEQIHNYFQYLECPYYNSDISERDLLLLLIQPSEKRYNLLEWMISRLEPDIDFYLPKDYGKGECVLEQTISKECTNAISYLKNLGFCYSRIMVPDIIHAKVGPLEQLKFLVRFLRGIRLKSWNRKPIIRNSPAQNKDNLPSNKEVKEENMDIGCNDSNARLENDNLNRNIIKFIQNLIEKNEPVKTVLGVLDNRLDPKKVMNIKEKLYFRILKRLTINPRNVEAISTKVSKDSCNMSFSDGIIQLLIEEILSPKDSYDKSSVSSSDCEDSYCNVTVKNCTSQSRSESNVFANNFENSFHQRLNMETNEESFTEDVSRLYTTSVNRKKIPYNGDEFRKQGQNISSVKSLYKSLEILSEKF